MEKVSNGIQIMTRREMVLRIFHGAKRITPQMAEKASKDFEKYGLIHSLPIHGPADEIISLVPNQEPIAYMVRNVRLGRPWTSGGVLVDELAIPFPSQQASELLAQAGLGIMDARGRYEFKIAPASPPAAYFINLSRLGHSRKGFDTRKIVQAFAPGKTLSRLGESRVLEAAEAIDNWGINTMGLLERRPRMHIFSRWVFDNDRIKRRRKAGSNYVYEI